MIKLTQNISINIMSIVRPIVYITIGILAYQIIKKIIEKAINVDKIKTASHRQRAKTIKLLIENIIKYIIVILVILAVLSSFGINVKSIVAGLGITTAIIGLAFQDLAKDLIAGISIITENQYEVGDTIEVDGFTGEVIFLGLKTTKIRNYKGAVKIIANHHMDKIINYSLNNSLAVVDVGTAYHHKPEEVEAALNKVAATIRTKIPESTGEMEIWGINGLDDSAVTYRVALPVQPMKHVIAERIIRREIKKAFDKEGISIPFPQVEVHNGK